MLQEKAAAASGERAPTTHPQEAAVDTGPSEEELPEKNIAASSRRSAALGPLDGNTTAQDREESDTRHSTKKAPTVSTAEIPDEHCTDTAKGVSGDMLHEHLAEEADTAKDIEESVPNEIVHVNAEDAREQEAKRLIKEMNASYIGEQISDDEFLGYYHRLPRGRSWIDLDDKLDDDAIDKLEVLHALCRFRYLKHQVQSTTLIYT
jgi:hypothetical protein